MGISKCNLLYVEWQKDYYYQLAMEKLFDNEVIRDNDTFFFADLNETEIGGQRYYSLNTNAYNVFNDVTRLFIPKVSNLNIIENEDDLKFVIDALDNAFMMKDYNPDDRYFDAVIVYECELSDEETLRLKFLELFNKNQFDQEIAKKGKMDVYLVDDEFTIELLKEYDNDKLHSDEDVLELLEEYKN